MEELMLVENPYWGNPRKRRTKMRKNPVGAVAKDWFRGVSPMEVGAAAGGLAMSTMLPGMIIRDTGTTGQKLLKLLVSAASAAAAGFIFQNVDAKAGKMAVAGGLAGTLVQGIGMFTDIQIGGPMGRPRALPVGRSRIGESRMIHTPEIYDAGVQVSVT